MFIDSVAEPPGRTTASVVFDRFARGSWAVEPIVEVKDWRFREEAGSMQTALALNMIPDVT